MDEKKGMYPAFIKDICPSCNPRSYKKTVARFIEVDPSDKEQPLVYECTQCHSKLYVSEKWANDNAIKRD